MPPSNRTLWGTMSEILRWILGPLRSNCYIISSGGEAVVIDPGWHEGVEEVVSIARRRSLDVVAIIATHGHFDHVSGVSIIKRDLGGEFMIHEGDYEIAIRAPASALRLTGVEPPRVPEPDRFLREGDAIRVGDIILRIMETPGHTMGSITILTETIGMVSFTGDTLFRGTIGRVDLPGSSPKMMRESLRRLARLPRETRIYPGHGPESTIGEELENNQYLQAVLTG